MGLYDNNNNKKKAIDIFKNTQQYYMNKNINKIMIKPKVVHQ